MSSLHLPYGVRDNVIDLPPQPVLVRNEKRELVRAWLIGMYHNADGEIVYVINTLPQRGKDEGHIYAKNEGRTWCRGWDDEALDALAVALALT